MPHPLRDGRHRILAFVLHPGVGGQAALDGFGLVPGSVSSLRLARARAARPDALATLLADAITRAKPTIVVLGIAPCPRREHLELVREARALLRTTRLPVVERHVCTTQEHHGVTRHPGMRFVLPERLAASFFPELGTRLPRSESAESHVRPLWHAVLLALDELARRTPRAAAALIRPGAELGAFAQYLAQCDRRRHPNPL